MKKLPVFFFALVLGLCLGCGDDGGSNSVPYSPETCSIEDQNEFVYKLMLDYYFWYDKISEVDYSEYESPEALFASIRYSELDRWGYITSTSAYYSYYESGQSVSLGFTLKYYNHDYWVCLVYKNSPADLSGLVRGDRLLEVNGKTIEEIEEDNLWGSIFGPAEMGATVYMKVKDASGAEKELSMSYDVVSLETILYRDIIEYNGVKVGYFVLNNFLETTIDELNLLFLYFESEGIDELILDMRYNSGGRYSAAIYLASLIAGDNAAAEVFIKYVHNDKQRDQDKTLYFEDPDNALDMDRIVIITSSATCSASEVVINGLVPYIDVVTVGDTTCGKPFGMHGYDFCDKHISFVEFQTVNALGEGDYYDGISPDIYSNDDLTREFGDIEEESLAAALNYLAGEEYAAEQMLFKPERSPEGVDMRIQLDDFRAVSGIF